MGDSDDDYERRNKGRDKFRRERDYDRGYDEHDRSRQSGDSGWRSSQGGMRSGGTSGKYGERRNATGPSNNYRSYGEPIPKRRRDDDSALGGDSHARERDAAGGDYERDKERQSHAHGDYEALTMPPVMSFKRFLETQEDAIESSDAVKRYAEYKQDFMRKQLADFFAAHKHEDWFRAKYDPDEFERRRTERRENVRRRLAVFNDLTRKGYLDGLALDVSNSRRITHLLDSVVVKLEGGTDDDLHRLDELNENASNTGGDEESPAKRGQRRDTATDKSESDAQKRGSDGNQSDADADGRAGTANEDGELVGDNQQDGSGADRDSFTKHQTHSICLKTVPVTVSRADLEEVCRKFTGFKRLSFQDPAPERRFARRAWITFDRSVNIKEICWQLANTKLTIVKRKPNAPDANTSGEQKDAAAKPPATGESKDGANGDADGDAPPPEVQATVETIVVDFAKTDGAVVNRDLKERVRGVLGLTNHRAVMKEDLQIALKCVENLDRRYGLWSSASDNEMQTDPPADSAEKGASESEQAWNNPLTRNMTEYLVDEGDVDEAYGAASSGDGDQAGGRGNELRIERDDKLSAALDRLVLYLRVVHSIDFYSCSEYVLEDEMPHRCGIVHVRNLPNDRVYSPREVTEYVKQFAERMRVYSEQRERLSTEEIRRLGSRDGEEQVEAFIKANTVEQTKEKWMCPLSGKKFKGPEFVRKHILNKYADRLDLIRRESVTFNNYLSDPKRVMLPEHPTNAHGGARPPGSASAGHHQQPGHSYYNSPPAPGYGHGPGGGGGYGSGYGHARGGSGGYDRPYHGDYDRGSYGSGGGGGGGGGGGYYGHSQSGSYGNYRGGNSYHQHGGGGYQRGAMRQQYSRGYGQQGGRYGGPPSGGPSTIAIGRPLGGAPGGRSLIAYNDLDAPEQD